MRETDGAKLRKVADTFGVQYSVDKTATGEVVLTPDGSRVDGRYGGYTNPPRSRYNWSDGQSSEALVSF